MQMTDTTWFAILSRTSSGQPVYLDDLILKKRKLPKKGKVVFPRIDLPPSVALWERGAEGHTYIGVRIFERVERAHIVARHLAAIAIERSVSPIVLSRVDFCGLEQFGFRVERVPDGPNAQIAEEELRKLWDLAIIIDGNEIGVLR